MNAPGPELRRRGSHLVGHRELSEEVGCDGAFVDGKA
jgi:hypothetical protein